MIDGKEVAKMAIKEQLKKSLPWVSLLGIIAGSLVLSWKYQDHLRANPMLGAVIGYVFLPIVIWATVKIHEESKEEEKREEEKPVFRMGDLQEILIHMASELLMSHVEEIRKESPLATNPEIIEKMIRNAYEKTPCCSDLIRNLSPEERLYLGLEMQRMAEKSIRVHDQFSLVVRKEIA
jgi:hypothetical protein